MYATLSSCLYIIQPTFRPQQYNNDRTILIRPNPESGGYFFLFFSRVNDTLCYAMRGPVVLHMLVKGRARKRNVIYESLYQALGVGKLVFLLEDIRHVDMLWLVDGSHQKDVSLLVCL